MLPNVNFNIITRLCFLILCSATHFAFTKYTSSYDRYSSCGLGNFKCDSGQCIGEHNLCDGAAHCADNSDETEEVCAPIHCPKFIYRCNYGACVRGRAECDGIRDCLDGSDEANCGNSAATTTFTPFTTTTKRRRPANSRPQLPVNCAIPNDPQNGVYTIGGQAPDAYRTGDSVSPFSVLQTTCNDGYQTSPSENMYSVCANGIWTPLPSKCSRFSQPNAGNCQCFCN